MFINSLNLGRYWSVGPQQSLYLPGPFLHSGVNQVKLFTDSLSFNQSVNQVVKSDIIYFKTCCKKVDVIIVRCDIVTASDPSFVRVTVLCNV